MSPTRERILTATNELFRRQGYNGTSLKQVTESAPATVGSLYHFFPGGKEALAAAVIETSGAAYRELFEMIADAEPNFGEAIIAFFDGAAAVLEGTDFVDICPIGTVAREVASTNDTLRTAAEKVFASWVDAAESRLIDEGIATTEAHELAVSLVASLEGGFLLARAARDGDQLRVIGRQIRRLVDSTPRSTGASDLMVEPRPRGKKRS